jgi:hypothetical protein
MRERHILSLIDYLSPREIALVDIRDNLLAKRMVDHYHENMEKFTPFENRNIIEYMNRIYDYLDRNEITYLSSVQTYILNIFKNQSDKIDENTLNLLNSYIMTLTRFSILNEEIFLVYEKIVLKYINTLLSHPEEYKEDKRQALMKSVLSSLGILTKYKISSEELLSNINLFAKTISEMFSTDANVLLSIVNILLMNEKLNNDTRLLHRIMKNTFETININSFSTFLNLNYDAFSSFLSSYKLEYRNSGIISEETLSSFEEIINKYNTERIRGNLSRPSKFQEIISELLKAMKITFEAEKQIDVYTIDFFIKPNICFEINGPIHYIYDSRTLNWKTCKKYKNLSLLGFDVRYLTFSKWEEVEKSEQKYQLLKDILAPK